MMKAIFLLWALFPGLIQTTVTVDDASKYIGKTVKLNCKRYKTLDNGSTVTFILNPGHAKKPLTVTLTGKARKNILIEMRDRRHLNREIASPLDTSLTVSGKIVNINGRLKMVVGRPSDIYLGADLEVERP